MPAYPKHLQCRPFRKEQRPTPNKKKVMISRSRKSTGELLVFAYVWATRPHECQVCSGPDGLPTPIHQPQPFCFAHQWGKGTHKTHRLEPDNIVLVCSLSCHQKVDAQRHRLTWPKVQK